jgi:quinol monooxygenase YgiN
MPNCVPRPSPDSACDVIINGKCLRVHGKNGTNCPGVKLFLPYRSPTNPAHFFIFELYVDEAGWKAHERTDHFKKAIEGLLPRLSRRERVPFVPFVKG